MASMLKSTAPHLARQSSTGLALLAHSLNTSPHLKSTPLRQYMPMPQLTRTKARLFPRNAHTFQSRFTPQQSDATRTLSCSHAQLQGQAFSTGSTRLGTSGLMWSRSQSARTLLLRHTQPTRTRQAQRSPRLANMRLNTTTQVTTSRSRFCPQARLRGKPLAA